MKCKQCGFDMEIYQQSLRDDELEIRYRCVCGQEHVEIKSVAEKPRKLYSKDDD